MTYSSARFSSLGRWQHVRRRLVAKPDCVQDPLIDLDPNTPNIIETDCQVHDRRPCDQPNVGGCQSAHGTRAARA